MENLALDENGRWALGGVTNDINQFILNARINPATNRLIVEGHVTSSNTSIGDTIPGGTEGSVLFLGPGSTLAQDNANFFWDDSSNFLGLGTDAPSATLDIEGTFKYADGSQANGYVLTSDASGNATWMPSGAGGLTFADSIVNSGGTVTLVNDNATPGDSFYYGTNSGGTKGFFALPTGSTAYNLIQNNGVSVTQETTINLSTLLTASDVASKTALTINTTNLANDSTFITALTTNTTFLSDVANSSTFVTDLIANTTFTTDLANDSNFYTTLGNNNNFVSVLTSNTTFQGDIVTIINNAGSSLTIDLATQVGTSILPLANGGTDTALSDPGADTLFGWDTTDDTAAFFTIGTGLTYTHSTHTLSASSGSTNFTVNADETQFGWTTSYFLIGDTAWTGTIAAQYGNGAQIGGNTVQAVNGLIGWNDSGNWANAFLDGVSGKVIKWKQVTSTNTSASGDICATGMFNRVTNMYSKTDHSDNRVQFLMDNANMYSITTDSSGITINTLSGVSVGLTNPHLLEIVLTCQTSALFYVDGVLKATHTTNIPTAEAIGPIILALGGNGVGTEIIYGAGLTVSQQI